MYREETIAAISTPPGTGGIGIIRISGDRAFEIAERIFKGMRPFSEIKSHTVAYGKIVDPVTGGTVDEVLLTKMKKPKTFTREDVVEISCHGGTVILRRMLDLVISSGARLAEPGEFTKRAFLNGRIDLSQAEAVIDLLNARTEQGTKAALEQLEGRLSEKLKEARQKLVELIAHIEVTVDYPEEDIEEITGKQVYDGLAVILDSLLKISSSFDRGRIIREGINIAIAGRPNVGKSSLLNALSGKNRAIVTDIPGTTRDTIEDFINIRGIPARVIDTAGIRETEDEVERIGVEKARKEIERADLVIVVVDASEGITDEDIDILKSTRGTKRVVLINKIDLVPQQTLDEINGMLEGDRVLEASVLKERGIDRLEEIISEMFMQGDIDMNSEVLLTNIRHKNLADLAIQGINEARKAYECGMPLDCMAIDIKNAAEYLGQITGESVTDEVLHQIFSRFCIGK